MTKATHAGADEENELSPQALLDMHWSFVPARVLAAGVQLGVFSEIAAGHRTAETLARACGASERGMRMLLDALAALGLLKKKAGLFELAPLAARYLVRQEPDYIGQMLEGDFIWQAWSELAQAVRSGRPHRAVERQQNAEAFFPLLIRLLHALNREPARRMAGVLGAGSARRGMRVLDVGCGSAVWSIAIAEADAEAWVTASDFPGVLEQTRGYLERHKVAERYRLLPGDFRQVDFGVQCYDLAILGNIVHSEGEQLARELFRRLYGALAPLGRLAIIDMIPNDDRAGPAYPLFFALNMLVNTEAGGTFTLAEYRQWLSGAGFSRVETAEVGIHSPGIVATKE